MARRSPSSTSTRSWRRSAEPETWWQKSGRAWEEQNWWQQDISGGHSWQDQSSGRAWTSNWQDSSSGRASNRNWQTSSSGRASTDATPARDRLRGHEERFEDGHTLRCPWPGPFTRSFPPKGTPGDWGSTLDAARNAGLVT
jgi:hypothetical protein